MININKLSKRFIEGIPFSAFKKKSRNKKKTKKKNTRRKKEKNIKKN